MKKLILICILTLSFSATASEQAKILMLKHIEASGGKEALEEMETISRDGNIVIIDEDDVKSTYCYHTDIVYPSKLREQLKAEKIFLERGTDGDNFWLWNGMQYEFTDDRVTKDYMIDTANRANRDMLWLVQEADKFDLMPSPPSWAPQNSHCIQDTTSTRIYCFDSSTGLENGIGIVNEYRLVKDWRRVGTIMLPFLLDHYANGTQVFTIQLDWARLDHEIADSHFTKPELARLSCEYE